MEIKEALELLDDAKTHWAEIYREAKTDLEMALGIGHWNDDDIRIRTALGRPCHVVNQLPQFIHQVTNDMRQNTPAINVLPISNGASVETAKVFKGLIKHIEYKSLADEVYDTAGEYAVKCSIGFARVEHGYIDDEAFEQELYIRRVNNPLSVWLDPNSTECDGSDAEWAICLDTISKKAFERKYKGKQFVSFEKPQSVAQSKNEIVIAELFIKEYAKNTKKDGELERETRKVTVKRYLMSGADILEQTTFPGKYIPVVPFYGEETWLDGKRHLYSLIRQSRDAQRRYNHWVSKESEILAMAPIAPVMAAAGQTEEFAKEWTSPGTSMVLRYKTTDTDGNPAPPPQRLQSPPVPTGFVNATQGAAEDVKKTMGMYNASIGLKDNETSGVAIEARQREGDVASFHFPDNRNRSIAHIGRILVCAIPEIYDTPRIIQIIGDEDEHSFVGVNGEALQPGQEQPFDLRQGKYDVRVVTGASYTTKRQEAATFMSEMVKTNPDLWKIAGDLLVKNMDMPGAEALAARLKKIVPKELTADEDKKNGEQAPDPEKMQMQAIIEQMQMQMQQMAQELESKQADTESKKMDVMVKAKELSIKEQESQTKAQLEGLKLQNEQVKLQLEAEKLQIEREKIHLEAQKPQEQPKPSGPTGIKLDTTGFQFMKTPEQEAMEAEQAQLEQEQTQIKEQEEAQFKQADLEMRMQQTEAVLGALNAITGQLANLSAQVSQPKQVVRDGEGRIVGVS